MQVIIPRETSGFGDLPKSLASIGMETIRSSLKKPQGCETVELHLPKFRIDTTLELERPLGQVGGS